MSGCNVTINRGDKGTKYVTVLGTDDHEVARELALERMGWSQADCSSVTVNPKSEDDPNHPTTIEVPVHHEPIPPSPENFVPRDQQEVPTELVEQDAEPQFQEGEGVESVSASEVDETILEIDEAGNVVEVPKDNPGDTLNLSASDAEDDGSSPERLDIEQPGDDQEQPDI